MLGETGRQEVTPLCGNGDFLAYGFRGITACGGGGGTRGERRAGGPMCRGLVDWQSDIGDGAWFLPPTEKVTESGNCMELGIACGGGSIGDGVGDRIKAVDNGVGWCDGWDGEVVMREVNSVGDVEGVGFGIDEMIAAVVLQGDANIESVRAAEVPGAASGWLIVGDDRAAKGEERGGIVVEGAIEAFPGGHAWCDGGLVEEVECQLCLWKEQVPKLMGEGGR
jgi:hypothetical protein